MTLNSLEVYIQDKLQPTDPDLCLPYTPQAEIAWIYSRTVCTDETPTRYCLLLFVLAELSDVAVSEVFESVKMTADSGAQLHECHDCSTAFRLCLYLSFAE